MVAGDHLNHIMRRATTNLDNGKRVLFSLRRFLSMAVKVDTSERFHRLEMYSSNMGGRGIITSACGLVVPESLMEADVRRRASK